MADLTVDFILAGISDGQWVACPNCGADMRGGDPE